MTWWVYLVQCNDKSLYCGITNDLVRRLGDHNKGRGAKYTAGRCPVKLIWNERAADQSTALKRERQIKKMARQQKLQLSNLRTYGICTG